MNSNTKNSLTTAGVSRGRLFQGLAAGSLAGMGASVLAGLLDTLAFSDGTRPLTVSPLVPLAVFIFSAFIFLPIVSLALNTISKQLAISLPPLAIAACCTAYVVSSSGTTTRPALLALSSFIFVLLPLLSASVVAGAVWLHPGRERK